MTQGSFAERLRVLRAQRGLALTEAAERIGIDRHTLRDLEVGDRTPRYPTLAKIAEGYGVPVEELLEESEWAWASTPDLDTFSRRISGLSTDDLRRLAVELSGGMQTRLLEDEPLARDEVIARVMNVGRADVVRQELLRRGEVPSEQFVVAYRRMLNALRPPEGGDAHRRGGANTQQAG
jgi:transcriptional regulator with XRE-family HTH domain